MTARTEKSSGDQMPNAPMQPRFVRQSAGRPRFMQRSRFTLHFRRFFTLEGCLATISKQRVHCSSRWFRVLFLSFFIFFLSFAFLLNPFISTETATKALDAIRPVHDAGAAFVPSSVYRDNRDDVFADVKDHPKIVKFEMPKSVSVELPKQTSNEKPSQTDQSTVSSTSKNDSHSTELNPTFNSENVSQIVDNSSNVLTNDREKYTSMKMSIVVLFHNEYESLNTALSSWIKYRLTDYADEVLFFLNGVRSEDEFHKRVPDYEAKIPSEKRRLELSVENLPLGLAITRMVELAKHDYVLLLEKDWELIENEQVMKSRLDDSKVLVGSGVAHLVRHRHRHDPGVPLHALIMHQGREESIFRQQRNLLCYCHHWMKDPINNYPGKGYMWHCGGKEHNIEEEDVWCSKAEYCNWTNNPGLFLKKWFMDEMGERYRKEYTIEKEKHGSTSPFLDFEYYTNWRGYAWTEKNFTVALGTGLFSHSESEHQHFNTFWYAHHRLTTDLEEIRLFYLRNETTFKKMGGVHWDPNYDKPPTMMERYPVEFVRKFQHSPMFTGTLRTQVEAVNDIYSKYFDKYRVKWDEWDMKGDVPPKAKQMINWRGYITDLHHTVEKAMMLVPPIQPHEMSITLVTVLLDLDRDKLADDEYKFRRDFKMYLDALEIWLTQKYKKIVYTSKDIEEEMLKRMSPESKETTKFVHTTKEDLASRWLGPDNFAKIQEIRTSKEWLDRASWLSNSPQASLEYYNPLVMSKMFIMRDAARQNLWNTTHFLFIDSKHNCRDPRYFTPLNDHIVRAHMFEKFLLTTFDYTPNSEVHGFEYEKFNAYCNMNDPKSKQMVRVGRGGIFGGSAFVLEYITAMYDVALTATLREGLMGTEENILSIVMYNVKQYVDEFSNNWACPDNLDRDHKCPNIQHQGYNCAIFEWVRRDAVEWKE